MKILITGASTAKAYQLKNRLKNQQVILGDYEEIPDLLLLSGSLIKIANPNTSNYLQQMVTICLDHDISGIYPLKEMEIKLLNAAKPLFEDYNIQVLT